MKIYFAADHGGFALKETLKPFVRSLGYEVEDCGAFSLDIQDDYPTFIQVAARKVGADAAAGIDNRAVLVGGSGQGEAFAANRISGVRAVVYYGEPCLPAGRLQRKQVDADGKEIDMITSTRDHNDSNVLSLGGRFLTEAEAKAAVQKWLVTPFSGAVRHVRRHAMLEQGA